MKRLDERIEPERYVTIPDEWPLPKNLSLPTCAEPPLCGRHSPPKTDDPPTGAPASAGGFFA